MFDQIREACAAVASQSTHVGIDEGRIPPLLDDLLAGDRLPAGPDPARDRSGDAEVLWFIVLFDTVNFGSGYSPHLRKRPGMSGTLTMAGGLQEWLDHHDRWTAEELATLTAADCAAVFGQPLDGGLAAELMGLFASAWNDLGRDLLARFEGEASVMVEAARGSAAELVSTLSEQPFFRDESAYRGLEVPFYKRAQLLAADLHLAFGGEGLGRFDDLDRLTVFADNLVPHVLRLDGVLHFEEELVATIQSEELIPSGSEEEIEIRAGAVHAVELMTAAAAGPVTARELDYLLWNRGQELAYKAVPRHRTRTVFY